MRLWQLIAEGEQQALHSDLMDLLVAAQAAGLDRLNTEDLVDQLTDLGHSVTPELVVDQFADDKPDWISNITVQHVDLSTPTPEPAEDPEQRRQRDISKQAMSNIRRRQQERRS